MTFTLGYVTDLLFETNKFNSLINRKSIKQACMTTLYGASSSTSTTNIFNSLIEQSIIQGIIATYSEEHSLRKLSSIMCRLLLDWLREFHPEASFLHRSIRYLCKHRVFVPPVVESEFSSWYYFPKEKSSYTKSIFNKDYKLHKYTEQIDFSTLKSGFVANYIQFVDAIIANKLIRKMADLDIPVISVHDCWYVPIQFVTTLEKQIRACYLEVLEANYLTVHFANNLSLLDFIEEERKKGFFGAELTAVDLNNPQFVKR